CSRVGSDDWNDWGELDCFAYW
nr:immunoglobulin heavy chain junction region [Macaca mulatta]